MYDGREMRKYSDTPALEKGPSTQQGEVKTLTRIKRWLRSEQGSSLIELTLILSLVVIVAVAILGTIGTHIVAALTAVSNAL